MLSFLCEIIELEKWTLMMMHEIVRFLKLM